MLHHIDALLFDLDGTLVETIHLYEEAMCETLRSYGIECTHEEFIAMYHRGIGIEAFIREHRGDGIDVSSARASRDAAYVRLLRDKTTWLPGAKEVLDATATIPRALVTKSWRHYVDAIDAAIGLAEHFSRIVTANEMQPYFKPHPRGFLLAADALGVDPERCLVIGDQLFDIEAARACGMRSFLIDGYHTPSRARDMAEIVGDLWTLHRLLSAMQ